jgi:hypothetical protein
VVRCSLRRICGNGNSLFQREPANLCLRGTRLAGAYLIEDDPGSGKFPSLGRSQSPTPQACDRRLDRSLPKSCVRFARAHGRSWVNTQPGTAMPALRADTKTGCDSSRPPTTGVPRKNRLKSFTDGALSDACVQPVLGSDSPVPDSHVVRRVLSAILGFLGNNALVIPEDLHMVGPGQP